MSLRKPLATLAGLTLAAVVLTLAPVTPAAAQDEGQDEALAYHAWFAANQQQDNAKAVEAAAAYVEKFPNGEYAEFLSKWLAPAQLSLLNEAIKAGDVGEIKSATDALQQTWQEVSTQIYQQAGPQADAQAGGPQGGEYGGPAGGGVGA